ncbi:MAG: glycosyltransferase family 1 protein [Acidobacteriota bacterium]
MRVGVVAYEMEGQRSGVGRYLEGLLQGLVDVGDDSTWRLYFKGSPFDHPLWNPEREGVPTIEPVFDHRPSARPIAWEQTRLPFRMRGDALDLVFSPGYSLPPLVDVPAVLTLHDLSFEHLPTEFGWKERWRRRHLARLGSRRAARVLADTETIADDLVRTYDLPREKVGIVPLAVDRRFFSPLDPPEGSADDLDAGLEALGVERPYVLFIGSVLPRRRLDLALAAFRRLVDQGAVGRPSIRFVLAGNDRLPDSSVDALIAEQELQNRVVRLDYAPEELLPALYARAEASIYLSTYEGYGLPPLESLAAGTPAVVAPGLALDDLVVDYAFRVERLEVDAVTDTLRRALDDPKRARIVDDARAAVRRLSWARCALRLRRELERALADAAAR